MDASLQDLGNGVFRSQEALSNAAAREVLEQMQSMEGQYLVFIDANCPSLGCVLATDGHIIPIDEFMRAGLSTGGGSRSCLHFQAEDLEKAATALSHSGFGSTHWG